MFAFNADLNDFIVRNIVDLSPYYLLSNNGISKVDINIVDIHGRFIITNTLNTVNDVVDISQMGKGMYFVKVNIERKSINLKFLK